MKYILLLLIGMILKPVLFAQDLEWAKKTGGSVVETSFALAVDAMGNVYDTGYFSGTISGYTTYGSFDIYIRKHTSNGGLVWAKRVGGTGLDQPRAVAVDAAGNVYVAGSFSGTADFDPGAGVVNLTSNGSHDIFILKLDASGNFVWAKSMGGSNLDYSNGIAVDGSENVYVSGKFYGLVDFDPDPVDVENLGVSSKGNFFVQKLDINGNLLWAKSTRVVSSGYASVEGWGATLAIDASGNVYTLGKFSGTVDFDPDPVLSANLVSTGSTDVFIQKWDNNGAYIWSKKIGGIGVDKVLAIALDISGNVHAIGSFSGTADFDPGAGVVNLISNGTYDLFVLKLDTNGDYVWAKNMGGAVGEVGYGIEVDASGAVYTVGTFNGTADFDPGAGLANLTGNGGYDIFIQKLSSNGDYIAAIGLGSIFSGDAGFDVVVGPMGNTHVVGRFRSTADFDPGLGVYNLSAVGTYDGYIQKLSNWSVLPVTFGSISAVATTEGNEVKWGTFTELNNDYFNVLKSHDGEDWIILDQYDGKGNSSVYSEYAAIDPSPYKVTYYKIQQVDFDGSTSYSKTVAVEEDASNKSKMLVSNYYPNPSTNVIYLRVNRKIDSVYLIDMAGRLVKKWKSNLADDKEIQLDVNDIPDGCYHLKVISNGTQEVKNVLIVD